MNKENREQNRLPLVSIIVPAYNVAPYIEECVQSLLEQSYKNIEIIIVNDGSTDKTGELSDVYSHTYSNVKVLHKKNGGLSSARNAGIQRAKGEYIAFVDSDDYVAPDYVKILLELLVHHDGDIAVCGFVRTQKRKREVEENTVKKQQKNEQQKEQQEKGHQKKEQQKEQRAEKSIRVLTGMEALNQLYSPKRLYYVVSWNKLYKTSLFDGVSYPEGMLHEDEAVIHKLYHGADKVVLTRKPLYYYYMSDSSIMRGNYKVERMGILHTYMERMEMFAQDKNTFMEDNSCKQCMVAALMHYYFCRRDKKIPKRKAEECLTIFHKCKSHMKRAVHISWKYKMFFKWASLSPYLAGKLVDIKVNRFYRGE